jgi:signal transduction histidine kinase
MSTDLEKILVVDDNENFLNMAIMALKRSNYQVDGAPDGPTALEMIRSQGPYAVMLTDRMMPEMDGLEVMERARQIDENLEVVIITAVGSLSTAITALRDGGAFDYLMKPLESVKQIPMVTERALAHRRLRMEREALNARVQAEAEWLQSLIANTGDAILAANADDELTIVNPATNRLLGRDDLIGSVAHISLPTPLAKALADWQAGGEGPASVEITLDQDSVQMLNLTPVVDGQGQRQGWIMVLRDITHLKQLDKLRTQMLSAAASNIRLPLAQGVTVLAELSILVADDRRASEIVYRLFTLWSQIQEWGDNLMTMAQIDADLDLHLKDVDLEKLLEKTQTGKIEKLINELKLQLNIDLEPELPPARVDPDLMQRLMEGLISRAIHRSKQNGEIRIHMRQQEKQIWIEVGDDGPAVNTADLSSIFEQPSAQVDERLGSTGLEINMAKTIADRMGGQVWVGGQGPRGSIIMVGVPAVSSAAK